jgi:hypothetical protein
MRSLLISLILFTTYLSKAQTGSLLLQNTAKSMRESANHLKFETWKKGDKNILYKNHEIYTSLRGEGFVSKEVISKETLVYFPNPSRWGSIVNPDTCFSAYDNKLLFLSINPFGQNLPDIELANNPDCLDQYNCLLPLFVLRYEKNSCAR